MNLTNKLLLQNNNLLIGHSHLYCNILLSLIHQSLKGKTRLQIIKPHFLIILMATCK
jgi:hypothetical protein